MPKMPKMRYIHCSVKITPQEYRIVREFAAESRLSETGFSLALRFIIQDWYELRSLAASWKGSRLPLHRPTPQDHADPDRLP
jgi:hypothetical protein